MAKLALQRKKKSRFFSSFSKACIVGWLFWVWVGGGWMRKREKQRDKEQRCREKREEREIYIYIYIILFCNLYYFNILQVKIKVEMLDVL